MHEAERNEGDAKRTRVFSLIFSYICFFLGYVSASFVCNLELLLNTSLGFADSHKLCSEIIVNAIVSGLPDAHMIIKELTNELIERNSLE